MASLALQDSNKKLLQTLEVNAEVLDNIHEELKLALSACNIQVHSFQEAQGISGMKGLDNKVRFRRCQQSTRLEPFPAMTN
jgi:hypothetical protein